LDSPLQVGWLEYAIKMLHDFADSSLIVFKLSNLILIDFEFEHKLLKALLK